MAWPRSVFHFASLRKVTLSEATLPVGVVRMLGDCPLVEHVEFRNCRVRIAVDYAVATPPKRHSTFLEQFLEPLARYKTVRVEFPHVVLVDMWAPPADDAPPTWGTLDLVLGSDEGLGALLQWAGRRGTLGFAAVTLTFHHPNAESMLTHHGFVQPVPTGLHSSFYRAAQLPAPVQASRLDWVAKLPCSRHELVLVDAFASGGHVTQRCAGGEYDVDVSDEAGRWHAGLGPLDLLRRLTYGLLPASSASRWRSSAAPSLSGQPGSVHCKLTAPRFHVHSDCGQCKNARAPQRLHELGNRRATLLLPAGRGTPPPRQPNCTKKKEKFYGHVGDHDVHRLARNNSARRG